MGATAGAIKAGRAFVEIFSHDNTKAGLERAQRRLRFFSRQVAHVGRQMTAFGAASLAPVALAVKVFTGFSDEMSKVKAITGASAAEFAMLNDKAKQLGRTTSFTASQVAGAMTELGRAGFKPKQIDTAIAGVLNLARATDTELPRAAEIAGQALRGFGLEIDQTDRVIDVLVATANNSAQGVEDIGEALKMVAPIAMEAGASIEETSAALGLLANNGIRGTMAGTAVARAYKNLSDVSKRSALEQLGIDAVDANDNLLPLSKILADLGKKTKNMGSAQRLSIFETLFGRGQAAALKLAGPQAQFDEFLSKVENADGVAEKTAKTMDDNLGGAFRKLMSAVEGIAIAIGESLNNAIRGFAERLTDISGWISTVVDKNREFVATLIKGIAIVGATGVALLVLGAIFSSIASIIGGVIAILGVLKAAFAILLSPIGLIVAAVGAIGAAILTSTEIGGQALGWLGEKFNGLKDTFMAAWGGIKDAIAAGDLQGAFRIVVATLNLLWTQATTALSKGWISFKEVFQQATADGLKTVMDLFGFSTKDLVSAFVAIEKAWVHTTSFLQNAWSTFTAGFMKIWNKAKGFVAKGIVRLKKAFGAKVDVEAVVKEIDAGTNRRNAQIDANRDRTIAERERKRRARLGEIDAGRGATQRQLDDFLNDGKRRERFRKQREAADAEVAAARAELDAAIKGAKEKREAQKEMAAVEGILEAATAAVKSPAAQLAKAEAGRNEFVKNAAKLSGVDVRSTGGLSLIAQAGRSSPQKTLADNTNKLVQQGEDQNKLLKDVKKNTGKKPKVSKFRR